MRFSCLREIRKPPPLGPARRDAIVLKLLFFAAREKSVKQSAKARAKALASILGLGHCSRQYYDIFLIRQPHGADWGAGLGCLPGKELV